MKNVIDTTYDEGKSEEEKKKNIIQAIKRAKLSVEEIAEDYQVTIEQVIEIQNQMDT